MNNRRSSLLLLALILALGIMLRLWGISYDLPGVYSIDEPLIMNKAIRVADGYFRHGTILRGSLPHYIFGGAIKGVSLIFPNMKGTDATLTENYQRDKTAYYVIARAVNALLSVTEIFLLFFIASTLFNISTAVLASLFLSITPLAIHAAHAIGPDTGLSTGMLVVILTSMLAYKYNNIRLFILAGFLSGLAAGQKFPGIFTLPLVILLFLYRRNIQKRTVINIMLHVVVITLSSLLAYVLSYPYIFRDFAKLIAEWHFENSTLLLWNRPAHYDFGILKRVQLSLLWLRLWDGTFLFYLSVAGVMYAIKKRHVIAIIIAIFSIAYVLTNAVPVKSHELRYVPVLPLLSLYAAYACIIVGTHFFTSTRRLVGMILLVAIVSAAPLLKSIFLALSYASPSTQRLLLDWKKAHNLDESMVLRDPYTEDISDFTLDWISRQYSPGSDRYIHVTPQSTLHRYAYAVVDWDFARWYFFWERYVPGLTTVADVYRYLDSSTKKYVEFIPRTTSIDREDLEFLMTANTWTFDQVRGPPITVYALQ